MKFLVSVCKKRDHLTNTTGLLYVDPAANDIRYLDFNVIPTALSNTFFKGKYINHTMDFATGLSYYRGKPIAIVTKTNPPSLITLDIERKKIIDSWFVTCPDPHSIFSLGDDFYVVGSGTNCLYKFDLDRCIRGPWAEDPNNPSSKHSAPFYKEVDFGHDVVHMNCATVYRGDIYISAFGEKKDTFWRSAIDGYVKNIRTGKKVASVQHPHSLVAREDSLYFCESRTSSVRNIDGDKLIMPKLGYTRGLAFTNNMMLVGTSLGRKVSKSTGLINNPSDPGASTGSCSIHLYEVGPRLNHYTHRGEIDLSPWAEEIYDILIL